MLPASLLLGALPKREVDKKKRAIAIHSNNKTTIASRNVHKKYSTLHLGGTYDGKKRCRGVLLLLLMQSLCFFFYTSWRHSRKIKTEGQLHCSEQSNTVWRAVRFGMPCTVLMRECDDTKWGLHDFWDGKSSGTDTCLPNTFFIWYSMQIWWIIKKKSSKFVWLLLKVSKIVKLGVLKQKNKEKLLQVGEAMMKA